jgi:predicted protein tyrosine phosphatase
MQIFALPKIAFDQMLIDHKVTEENVEQQEKLAFISINNHERDKEPYFKKDHPNVKVMWFDDVDQDYEVPSVGTPGKIIHVKAFTLEQAKELYAFIKANKHRHTIFVHCTAGVARSGAVATFINDFVSGNWETFKRHNASIQPNAHVYRLLHDIWYEDHAFNDSITGKQIQEIYPNSKISVVSDSGPSRYEETAPNGDKVIGGATERQGDYVMILTNKYSREVDKKYGIDGSHFQIPLDRRLKPHDVITPAHKDLKPLIIIDEPIEYVLDEESGRKVEYWVHTVKVYDNDPSHHFYPRKFLVPGMLFQKI